MKRTNTVRSLALSKLRYNKSRTMLTGIAIMLTTMLLMAIGTVGTGALDMNRQIYAQADYHARFGGLTPDQVNVCQIIFRWKRYPPRKALRILKMER